MAPVNCGRCWTALTLIIALGASGCGQQARQSAAPTSEGSALITQPDDAVAAPPPTIEQQSATGAEGVALPRANPAPSALFNAAYQRKEGDWEQVLYLCDGIGGDRVKLVTMPNAKGLSELWTYRKPDFRTDREPTRLSDEDPGAGQIMRELQTADGKPFGSVHSINPGMMGDAQATTMPTLGGITDKAETTQCRWMPRGRVLLVDARRSVLVTAEPDGSYTYRSYDYAKPGKVMAAGQDGATSTPTSTVTNGRLISSTPGHEVYEFHKNPWTYRVSASADNRALGASLAVLRDGKTVSTSVAAAYQMAAKRIE